MKIEGRYKQGDTVWFDNPNKNFGDGQPWQFMITLDGKCNRQEVAQSRAYWSECIDGGYLYANKEPVSCH